jgi:DNA-binding NtrC family response regulator
VGYRNEILILDDEPIVGVGLKSTLEKEGHCVEAFVDPEEAFERIALKEFDIVVTDFLMDNMDGIQILDHTRNKSKRTKVVIITGYATVELARRALSKGVFDFIAKPFKPEDIREIVRRAAEALRV